MKLTLRVDLLKQKHIRRNINEEGIASVAFVLMRKIISEASYSKRIECLRNEK